MIVIPKWNWAKEATNVNNTLTHRAKEATNVNNTLTHHCGLRTLIVIPNWATKEATNVNNTLTHHCGSGGYLT